MDVGYGSEIIIKISLRNDMNVGLNDRKTIGEDIIEGRLLWECIGVEGVGGVDLEGGLGKHVGLSDKKLNRVIYIQTL